ncbi:MAG: nucleobase:cation symporter, family [Thermacetogenium sp.]|jgi:NCS1 family nucleobase:cation symporter-1|nr:nucleobase:cation symporter, family [Thermacetogenium sp.]
MEKVYEEKVLEVEPFGIEPIPKQERHGRARQLFTLWFASNLNVVTWFTGFLGIEFGLSLKYAVLAIVIGNLLGGVLLALASAVGPQLGRPLIPGSRRAFGKVGVVGLSFLNLVNNIGWLAVNLVLAVMAFRKIVPSLGYHPALLILTVATMLIAVYGYNFIHTFAHWMSIVIGALFLAMTVISVSNLPHLLSGAESAAGGVDWGMFILAVAVAFSYQISYCPIGSDYSRYLPESTPRVKAWLATYLGCVTVCIWLEILGALTATLGMHAGPMDFFARLTGVFTVPALIAVILSIMPINAMAVYSGGLAALAMGIPMKRWVAALVTAGIGALLISFGGGHLAETYKNFLLLLSYWIAPWLGVVLCDIFFNRQPEAERNGSGWPGMVSFICGVVISIPFMSSVLYTGPIARNYLGGADISYFLSMTVTALLYLIIIKAKNAVKKETLTARAPVGAAGME